MAQKRTRSPSAISLNKKRYNSQSTKACTFCKSRKIKCNSNEIIPCTNCSKSGNECIPSNDKRSLRPSIDDLLNLQEQVTQLESFIHVLTNKIDTLNEINNCNNNNNNNNNNLDNQINNNINAHINNNVIKNIDTNNDEKYPKPKVFQKIINNSESETYGPISIFNSSSLSPNPTKKSNSRNNSKNNSPKDLKNIQENETESPNSENSILHNNDNNDNNDNDDNKTTIFLPIFIPLKTLNKDPTIIKYIKTFFQWLYPDIHMFIPRETFLIDFYHPRLNKKQSYCSIELVYSICSIGSLISNNNNLNISQNYYSTAKHLLFLNIDNPSITTLQSFLLLGLYDMYRGKNNSCWLLSGIGLRLGFDIGFHLNSNNVNNDININNINKLSLLFKSRIYWGCFIVDHFIGMILGRPSILQINDSTLEESDRVPDLDWIKDFNFKENDIIDVANPLKSIIRLIVLTEKNTHEIFFFEKKIYLKFEKLLNFNKEIKIWKDNLIPELKFDNLELLKIKSTKPPDMIHIYYYYIVLLCINRPFLDINKFLINKNFKSKRENIINNKKKLNEIIKYEKIVYNEITNAIKELNFAISIFVTKYGYYKCSILIIYSSIIIVSIIIIMNEKKENYDINKEKDEEYFNDIRNHKFYGYLINNLNLLKQSGKVWGLAKERFKMFEKKLNEDYDIDFEFEFYKLQQGVKDNQKDDINSNNNVNKSLGLINNKNIIFNDNQNDKNEFGNNFDYELNNINSKLDENFNFEMNNNTDFGTEWTEWMGLIDIDLGKINVDVGPEADDFDLGNMLNVRTSTSYNFEPDFDNIGVEVILKPNNDSSSQK